MVQTLTSTVGQGDLIDGVNLDDNKDDADDECYDHSTDKDDEHHAIWDLFCVSCVLRGINITPFPLRFRSCDIRLTSYSIQSPTVTSQTSTRTKLRDVGENESRASEGRARGKRKVKLT